MGKNREEHNRIVCYEVSRYLAQSLAELFKDREDFNVCILWDKGLTHYFVAVTCKDYSITLDLDDFNGIKDLTRIKTGLTAEGIHILEDHDEKFKSALDKFQDGRSEEAIKKIETEIAIKIQNADITEELDDIVFLKYAVEVLKENNIDSPGLFEFMKEVVDMKLGPQARKKVWKEIAGDHYDEMRYTRCLVVDVEEKKYIIDVDEMLLRPFDEEELKKENRVFIPFREILDEEVVDFRRGLLNKGLYNGR